MGLPYCAAQRCPLPNDCQGYINSNDGNELPLTACCKLLCGDEVGILALQCGGASSVAAYIIVFYSIALFVVGAYMVIGGWILSLKRLSFWITTFGTVIFMTVTMLYVTFLTSPFKIVEAIPAVGAMNIAIFCYFFSGYQYSIGVAYEGSPLVALATTSQPVWRAILASSRDGSFLRDANWCALVMLVMAFIWVLHSVSYRILGYRVEWRITEAPTKKRAPASVNPCNLLGAAQGHPTWRTPVGQCTSVVLMALAWAVSVAVKKDLANQCRADWVLKIMMWLPPPLITGAVGNNLLTALRIRTILGIQNTRENRGFRHFLRNVWEALIYGKERRGEYPFLYVYKDHYENFSETLQERLNAYVQAVALHRRGRNTFAVEKVADSRLERVDYLIGFLAWLLASFGLLMAVLVVLAMYVLTESLGTALEAMARDVFKPCVSTTLTEEKHTRGANLVLEESYVGRDFGTFQATPNLTNDIKDQRYINLPYLLDNIGHEELHVLLNE